MDSPGGTRNDAGPNMLVVLGISAIDVLCCALVCSLVLFLMLSQARSTKGAPRGKGTNKDLLVSLSMAASPTAAPDDWPVVRVRVFEPVSAPPSAVGGTNLLFWGDQREVIREDLPLLVLPDHGQVIWTSDDLPESHERLSVLQIHNPRPGYARVELAYVDSKSGLAGPAERSVRVNVSVTGAVSSHFTIDLNLDSKACLLGANTCMISSGKGRITESLHVLP